MADITDKVEFEIKSGSKNLDSSVDRVINDLKNLNSTIMSTSNVTDKLREQFGKLGVSLDGSKLRDTFRSLDSDTLKYTTTTGKTITVVKRLKGDMDDLKVSVRNVNNEAKKSKGIWGTLTTGLTGAITKIQLAFMLIPRIGNKIIDITDKANDYEEALNLFTVTMGENAKKAKEWVEMFSEALYLDDSNVMQYMGSLNSLISGLGVASDKSYIMSKNLTQLVYDLSSFKNLDIETSFRKIQSAMSGEIEPLRNVGVALSQNTLQELANSMGIDERVASMSEANKAQLRYIQILKSTTEWQGDMARTLISPANAIRVLKQQFTLLGRAIGRMFIPFVMKAIPYVMALTQMLTDLANRIASFFGYKITDIDYSSLKDMGDFIEDVGEEAEDTTKKLQTMLAPFDELNVVQKENEKAGKDGGLGSDLGLDLPEYDALAGLTDQLSKNVEKAKDNLKQILEIVGLIGAAFLSWKIASGVIDFLDAWNKIGGSLQKKIGLTLIISSLALNIAGALDIKKGDLEKGLLKQLGAAGLAGFGTFLMIKSNKGMSLQTKIGISFLVSGVSFALSAIMDKDHDFTAFLVNLLGGSASVAAGTFMVTKNVTVTFAVTTIYAAATTLFGFLDEMLGDGEFSADSKMGKFIEQVKELNVYKDLSESADKFTSSLKDQYAQIEIQRDANAALIDHHRDLYEELKHIVDENGKVKDGYEDRAKFILDELSDAYGVEYQLINGEISNYDKLRDSIEQVITKKKLEILLEANKDAYVTALKNEKEATDKMNDAHKKLNDEKSKLETIEKKIKEARKKTNDIQGKSISQITDERKKLQELEKEYDFQKAKIEGAQEVYDSYKDAVYLNTEAIKNYESGMVAAHSDNMDEINAAIDRQTGHNRDSLQEQLEDTIGLRDATVDYWKRTNGEIENDDIRSKNEMVQSTIDTLKNQTRKVEDLTPDNVAAWQSLAKLDKNAYNNAIKDLPEDVRKKLTSMPNILQNDLYGGFANAGSILGKAMGSSISNNLQIDPTTLKNNVAKAFGNLVINISKLGNIGRYAEGGFPSTGEFFMAREDGPEMVGRIGNKTAVANNEQITTSITNALVQAFNGMNFGGGQGTTVVNIGGRKVYEGVGDYVDSENDRYGTNYVNV